MRITVLGALAGAILAVPAVAETPVERGEYLVRGIDGLRQLPHADRGAGLRDGQGAGRAAGRGRRGLHRLRAEHHAGRAGGGLEDAELARAIREGIRPDGSLIGPPMPFAMYRGLGDEDLAAIVAFLRTLPAVENEPVPESEYRIPLPPAYGPAGRERHRAGTRRHGGIRRLSRRAGGALHGVPHADGAAGADARHRARPGRLRLPRGPGAPRSRRT
jgi:hypothetical protein